MYSEKSSQNRPWIDMFDPICVARWTHRLNLSEPELRAVVRSVGGYVDRVQAYLNKHKTGSNHAVLN